MNFSVQLLAPAEKFLSRMDTKLKAKTFRTIELLAEFGNELREPFSKKIRGYDSLFELRVKHGSDICRLFYFFEKDKIIIITSGFIKKDQKTDRKLLDQAYQVMRTYKEQ